MIKKSSINIKLNINSPVWTFGVRNFTTIGKPKKILVNNVTGLYRPTFYLLNYFFSLSESEIKVYKLHPTTYTCIKSNDNSNYQARDVIAAIGGSVFN